ncbi:hypothetical protein TNCV_2224361 [Trichonephila clavipes]|nr:hypothetical protein TNCV_2224361 [Trichonephila clavipes]
MKFLQKLKVDVLKFKLKIVEALVASELTNKNILTDDEDDSDLILPATRSKHYNPPANIPCQDMYSHFRSVDEISR